MNSPFQGTTEHGSEAEMSEQIAGGFVGALSIYAAIGAVFAVAFVLRGVNRIDPVATESTWGFRAMIFAGSAALGPVLLKRWILGQAAPDERNPHRDAARGSR